MAVFTQAEEDQIEAGPESDRDPELPSKFQGVGIGGLAGIFQMDRDGDHPVLGDEAGQQMPGNHAVIAPAIFMGNIALVSQKMSHPFPGYTRLEIRSGQELVGPDRRAPSRQGAGYRSVRFLHPMAAIGRKEIGGLPGKIFRVTAINDF
jgi:hypothetical protein